MYTFNILHAWYLFMLLLLTADFFQKFTFSKNSFRSTIRLSNNWDPDQDRHFVDPDLGPNCLRIYQQTTKVIASKESFLGFN